MMEPEEVDLLISEAVATYIPEPSRALGGRTVRRVHEARRRGWLVLPMALAASLAVALLLKQQPVPAAAPKPRFETGRATQVATMPLAKLVPAVHRKRPRSRHPRINPPLTNEEKLWLAVAEKVPNQFPSLITSPERKAIEPIVIADLQAPAPLLSEDKFGGD